LTDWLDVGWNASLIFTVAMLLLLVIFLAMEAYAQDFDERYACLYADQYPFNEMCADQRYQEFLEHLLNGSENEEWQEFKKFK